MEKRDILQSKPGWFALTPLIVFLLLYLVLSLLIGDFYKVPIPVAFLLSSVFAIATTAGIPLRQRIEIFSTGTADKNVLLMIWIFILAGAFARSAEAMGAIGATVNLTLHLIPNSLLVAGIFIAACFISLAVGTSVGTVVALTPVAAGIAAQTGASLPFMVAVVVGGAFFGDNLSFISDTTIAATRTQGVAMKDKFRVNSLIVIPVAVLMLLAYIFLGAGVDVPADLPEIQWIKVIPYLLVLILAIVGVDVTVVLLIGMLSTGLIGFFDEDFGFFDWFGAMGEGITGMGELIIVTMLAAGLLAIIRHNGGIDYIISRLTRNVSGKRGAELSIAALVSIANVCTANNTIAIITVGGIAKNISDKFGLDPRKTASILDTFSCFVQGVIPYGAQLLMAAGLAGISPVAIVPYLYYPMALGVFSVLAILIRYPRKYS